MTENRVLGGRYQLGELLGYGGMAEVHHGRDQRLGRDVAIKILRTDLVRDPSFQARFRREAQNAASLNHPSIVAVYDTGEETTPDGPLPYIVMEYVEGQTLKETLTAEGRIMPERALEIVADVCSALDFSHRNGIVHRDIKPANVMLTTTGAVKVMDFGIARAMASTTATMTQTSAVIGTAQYLSPEQARGETVDARSDLYSTGCLLYELLVGHPPFTGDNPVSVAYQHVREDPTPPSELNRDVTPDIDAVVLKAMAKNPINRYQSAAEMRSDLLRAAAGRPVAAPPVYSEAERTQVMGASTARIPANGAGYPPYDEDDAEEDPGRKKKKALIWTLSILGLLTIFALAAFATYSALKDDTPQVTVPSVVGDMAEEAQDKLETQGFTVTPVSAKSSAEDKGKVIQQDPEGGSEVSKGTNVTLTVGAGPESVDVPDLTGMTRTTATKTLEDRGLVPQFKDVDSAQPKDTVVGQSPDAGSSAPPGQIVTVQLSKGNQTEVPNVVGLSEQGARTQLEGQGFRVTVRYRTDNSVPDGNVVEQNPVGGQQVEKNSTVTIYVARNTTPSPTSPTPTDPTTPTP